MPFLGVLSWAWGLVLLFETISPVVGPDIVSLTIRKKTGKNVGSISFLVNGTIMLIAGLTFGWEYALYSMITIFVSSRVTDAVFTKQKRMQAMIVTNHPEKVIEKIHKKLHRGQP